MGQRNMLKCGLVVVLRTFSVGANNTPGVLDPGDGGGPSFLPLGPRITSEHQNLRR